MIGLHFVGRRFGFWTKQIRLEYSSRCKICWWIVVWMFQVFNCCCFDLSETMQNNSRTNWCVWNRGSNIEHNWFWCGQKIWRGIRSVQTWEFGFDHQIGGRWIQPFDGWARIRGIWNGSQTYQENPIEDLFWKQWFGEMSTLQKTLQEKKQEAHEKLDRASSSLNLLKNKSLMFLISMQRHLPVNRKKNNVHQKKLQKRETKQRRDEINFNLT